MYTTIETVRTMSWLDDDINITDPNIKSKILRACSMVDSAIGCIYTLPIKYRYQNIITFSWTTTWSWTMAIVINWNTYNVTITSWDSLDTIADIFRALTPTDFVFDWLWLWEEVTIISESDSENDTTAFAEVNITSAPVTVWITATIWSRITRYPQTLDQVAAEIATALLFIDIYWIEAQDSWKDGENRMDRVNELLMKLQWVDESWQVIKIFDDVTKVEISTSSLANADSYPNDTSDVDTLDPTSPKAFINKVF